MRKRELIEKDPKVTELLIQEILLDIRELLTKQISKGELSNIIPKKRGRPRKIK